MVALKGKPDIGDQINKKIIAPLAAANKLSDMPDFNEAGKLGSGQEIVERLTNLIAIFENKALDFSKNRAEGDDILGDAYEYLMRHFATESGKSKGQFYTPAEVSRIMAQIIGIRDARTTNDTTVYDPTCGSGSLLLKVGDEAQAKVTLYGQEKDAAPEVELKHNKMRLQIRPASSDVRKQEILEAWYRERLKEAVPELIAKWEPLIGVKVERFFVQRMKTKWGSCSPKSKSIRLNTELAKKPLECLKYIVVHEMVHLLEPTHNTRFITLMDRFMPKWRFYKDELNKLPVRHENWAY